MDLYAPAPGDGAPAPVALFVHGGAWSVGDKRSAEGAPEVRALAARGYLVAAVNYRLAPQYAFPAPIEDVKCAVRYLRAHAGVLHLDSRRIGAWGASAGGMLVALLGGAGPAAGLEGDGGYATESSRVAAVVDMYGRADLQAVPLSRPDLLPIFGGVQNLRRYSPVTYVSPDAPPFLILHGERDAVVPPALSQEFADRLRAAGVPVTLVLVRHAGHGFGPAPPGMSLSRGEITQLVGNFFDRYLRGAMAADAAGRSNLPAPRPPICPGPGASPSSAPAGRVDRLWAP